MNKTKKVHAPAPTPDLTSQHREAPVSKGATKYNNKQRGRGETDTLRKATQGR